MEFFPFLVLIFIPFYILIEETCGLLRGKLTHNDQIRIVKISISLNFFFFKKTLIKYPRAKEYMKEMRSTHNAIPL